MCLASVANFVVSGSADSTSRLWARERDGQHACLAVLVGHRGPIRCVEAITEDRFGDDCEENCSYSVCTGSLDGVLKLWRVTQKKKKVDNNSSSNSNNQCSSQQNEAMYFEL